MRKNKIFFGAIAIAIVGLLFSSATGALLQASIQPAKNEINTQNTPSNKLSALAYDYEMVVNNKTVAAGSHDQIVTISGNWAAKVGAYQFLLSYDPAVVTAVTVTIDGTPGQAAGGIKSPTAHPGPGAISTAVYWLNTPYGIEAGSGVLFKLHMNISSSAPVGSSPLVLMHTWNVTSPFKSLYTTYPGGVTMDPHLVNGALTVTPFTILCGDANGDGVVNISDAVFLIAYIFSHGAAPNPLCRADANGDGTVNISDAVFLIAYIFSHGAAPHGCCQ